MARPWPRKWVAFFVLTVLLTSGLLVAIPAFISPPHQAAAPQSPLGLALANPTVDKHGKSQCATVTTCQINAGALTLTYPGESAFIFVSYNASAPTWSVHDSQGDTYHVIAYAKTSTLNATVWATYNIPAKGSTSFYVNASTSSYYIAEVVILYGTPVAPIDVIGAANGGNHATTYTSSVTPTISTDIILAIAGVGHADTFSAGSVGTLIDTQSGTVSGGTYYYVSGGTTAVTMSMAGNTAGNWESISIAIKLGTLPSAPTLLAVSATTTTSITWTWTPANGAVANQTAYYATYSSGSCGAFTGISVNTGTNTKQITGLSTNAGECLAVSDWNSTGQGTISAPVVGWAASVPAAPSNLAASSSTTTTVTLTWTNPTCSPAVSCSLVNSTIEYGTVCATPTLFISVGTAVQTYTVTGLTSGTTECYAVVAWNATGTSLRSSTYSIASGPPKTPTALTIGSITETTIGLSWTLPGSTGPQLNSTMYAWAGGVCSGAATVSDNVAGTGASGTVIGLTTGVQYGFEVSSWNSAGQGPKSSCVTAVTAQVPAAPTALTVSGTSTTTATLSWTNPSPPGGGLLNSTVYYWSGGVCSGATGAINIGSVVSGRLVTGLAAQGEYSFKSQVWNATGGSPDSACAAGYTTPSSPSGLSATTVSSTQINLVWTNPTGSVGLTDNHVYVFAGGVCGGSPSGIDLGGVFTSYPNTGLAPATTYSYEITASDTGGEGAVSSCAMAKTYDPVPNAPTALTATAASTTRLNLAWTNPGGPLTDNHVYEYNGGVCGGSPTAVDIGSVATTFADTGLTAGTTYSFEVTASSSGGESAQSTCAAGTTLNSPPGKPTGLVVVVIGDSAAKVSWTNPAGSIVGDNLTLYSATCAAVLTKQSFGVNTTWTLRNLLPATAYCVTVDASTNGGQGLNATPYANFTTDAFVTPTITVSAVGTNAFNEAWNNGTWTNVTVAVVAFATDSANCAAAIGADVWTYASWTVPTFAPQSGSVSYFYNITTMVNGTFAPGSTVWVSIYITTGTGSWAYGCHPVTFITEGTAGFGVGAGIAVLLAVGLAIFFSIVVISLLVLWWERKYGRW